jgi:primosomal protein N' (replication factor Y)
MGSATPSVEAWHLMQSGRIRRLALTKRLAGGDVPTLRAVDLNKDPGPLSHELIEALKQTREEGRQSILFLNRRGFAHFFHCRSCGYTMQCKNCSVGMTYHKARNLLTCHYCGFKSRPVTQCPDCGSFDVGYSGFGTERIAEELERLFPDWSIVRLDTDSVKKKGVLEQTIRAFRDGEIDVLLGTQMVAKGLNFPGVKLVGIVLADTGLHMPDFRASERTFGLIVQVAGRAGRYHPDGEVIVQSYAPGNVAIARALRLDIDSFYREELSAREQLGFPPFARLIRFIVRGKQSKPVSEAVERLAELLAARTPSADEILGPAECPLGIIAGNHRHQVIVRTSRFGETHQEVEAALHSFDLPAALYLEVDVDPVALL